MREFRAYKINNDPVKWIYGANEYTTSELYSLYLQNNK